ncbi:MAG: hypothetical protein GZ089_14215 [Aromatoleum sp.]|nr:hypothetical protein [Aromatoleum sp.]
MVPTSTRTLGFLLTLVASFALAACSMPLRPDLARLYRAGAEAADTTPVIIIPGLFGSRLRDRTTEVEVWPGAASAVLFGDYRQLELKFDRETLAVQPDNLEAFGLADQILGQAFYGPLVDTLQRFGGYVAGTPGTPAIKDERRYYIFPYDWRQHNVLHARSLERLIDTIRRDYGDPTLRVDLVAHSVGSRATTFVTELSTCSTAGATSWSRSMARRACASGCCSERRTWGRPARCTRS